MVVREAKRRHARTHVAIGKGPHGYQEQNLAAAEAAVGEVVGEVKPGYSVERELMSSVPGRAELVAGDPIQIFDAAHNPDGARALAELLPELVAPREVRKGLRTRLEPREAVCCLAVLDDKDAKGIIKALAPAVAQFICTEIPPEAIEGSGRPGGRSHPASELAEIARQGGAEAEAIADPMDAWRRVRELARDRDGVALAAGSHYLLSCIWTERPDQSS